MLRRTISRASSCGRRWCGSAPQHPPPATRIGEMPMRSSTRAMAASMFGFERGLHAAFQHDASCARVARRGPRARASVACRACVAPARAGSRPLNAARPNSSAVRTAPSSAAPRRQRMREARSAARARRPGARRSARPMSSSRPYWTPEGQVVSQLRQVRQRSRCSCVFAVTGVAFEHLLDEVDAPARDRRARRPATGTSGRSPCRSRSARTCAGSRRLRGPPRVSRISGGEVGLHQKRRPCGRD